MPVNASNEKLGWLAPDFSLIDVSGDKMSLDHLTGENGTVIAFICNHCPFVVHVKNEIVKIANEYLKKGFGFVAINSNDIVKYPEDSPYNMQKYAVKYKFSFPYLFDETQKIAEAYGASCTPDFFLFDKNLKLIYRGQLDDSRPTNKKTVTGNDLRIALDRVVKEQAQKKEQKPSIGCNIKWK